MIYENKFPSLREFLLLEDPSYNYPRSIFRATYRPETLVKLYDIAQASFMEYGDAGPPIGSKVYTLVSGHGGGPGAVRDFDGDFDSEYFAISRFDNYCKYDGEKKQISLVLKKYWWLEIAVIDKDDPIDMDLFRGL